MDDSKGQVTKSATEIYDEFFVPALFQQWAPADGAGSGPGARTDRARHRMRYRSASALGSPARFPARCGNGARPQRRNACCRAAFGPRH